MTECADSNVTNLENILLSLGSPSERESLHHALFSLLCERVLAQSAERFLGDFGLNLLKMAALRYPTKPILVRYLVRCIRRALSSGGPRTPNAPLYNEVGRDCNVTKFSNSRIFEAVTSTSTLPNHHETSLRRITPGHLQSLKFTAGCTPPSPRFPRHTILGHSRPTIDNDVDALGENLVGACARAGDAYADVLAELVRCEKNEVPLFDVAHRNTEGYSPLHVACLQDGAEAGAGAATAETSTGRWLRTIHVLLAHAHLDLTEGVKLLDNFLIGATRKQQSLRRGSHNRKEPSRPVQAGVSFALHATTPTENVIIYKGVDVRPYSTMHETTAVRLVTKASQRRKIGMRGWRRKDREALNLRITSFAGNSERQSFDTKGGDTALHLAVNSRRATLELVLALVAHAPRSQWRQLAHCANRRCSRQCRHLNQSVRPSVHSSMTPLEYARSATKSQPHYPVEVLDFLKNPNSVIQKLLLRPLSGGVGDNFPLKSISLPYNGYDKHVTPLIDDLLLRRYDQLMESTAISWTAASELQRHR
ncbi:hypothetical protein EVAR_98384_1 [Eumeta japonica]|uniref:Uncharacterized protein n=1 Tax=Eumeta variegata TaxID=151549 RepID=A0A4C1XPC2_EUMVA|nr:hypothetical protein EVAR_98384_1 [Eumeta japonica]